MPAEVRGATSTSRRTAEELRPTSARRTRPADVVGARWSMRHWSRKWLFWPARSWGRWPA